MSPEEVSLALHIAVADRLAQEPSILEEARRRVRAWCDAGDRPYAVKWREILSQSTSAIRGALTEIGEPMQTLRSASPFAGALPPRERWALLRRIKSR